MFHLWNSNNITINATSMHKQKDGGVSGNQEK